MNIIGKLFDSFSSTKKAREVADFFQINIKKIPLDTFNINQSESLELGDGKTKYHKHLTYKECGLFDQIEVVVFKNGSANIIFFSDDPDQINMKNMKDLINNIYQIYGLDSLQRGEFTNEDASAYHDSMMNFTFGRRWNDFEEHKYHVAIDRYDEKVTMTIWGVNR